MTKDEIMRIQSYLRMKFSNDNFNLRQSPQDDMAEVLLGDEFLGTLCRDEDEGEISYALTMSILDFDLEDLPQAI